MRVPAWRGTLGFAVLFPFLFLTAPAACGEEPEAEAGEEAGEEEGEEEESPTAGEKEKDDSGEADEKGKTAVKPKDLTFERLVEANGPLLFGGKTKVEGDRFEVLFNGVGQVKAGFEGTGIHDSKSDEMKGANRRFIRLKQKKNNDEPEQLIPGLAAIGIGDGSWVSRFPVAGEPWVEMGFRVPNLIGKESTVRVRVNWKKKTGYETNFFKTISYISNGTMKGTQTTPLKEYQGPPTTWFPRKGQAIKAEFGIKDGRVISRLDSKDLVELSKASDRGGHIGLSYSKLLFTIQNLKVSGKLDRAWCEKEIERLRKEGKLKTAPDPSPEDEFPPFEETPGGGED